MKNAIRAVLCLLCTAVSAIATYSTLSLTSYAANMGDNVTTDNEVHSNTVYGYVVDSVTVEQVNCELLGSAANREIPVYTLSNNTVVVGSVELRVGGRYISTEPVSVNADRLMSVYNDEYEAQDWDTKDKIKIINTLWDFLVEQNGVNEYVAAAIIGATMDEGRFAEEQGTYKKFDDIEQARKVLGAGIRGYGVAQWTYKTRQVGLLNYYELANELYPDDWEKACIVAECCMLLREIEAYGVFDSLYENTTIEDAVGRMCLKYEVYEGVYEQWSSEGGYHLISRKGSGIGRLVYSENIYSYFMGE